MKLGELKRDWTTVLGGALTMYLCIGLGSSYGIINVVLLDRLQGTTAATSMVGALCLAVGHILAPVVGLLYEKWKVQYISGLGAVLFSGGVLCCAFAKNLIQLYVSFGFVTGAGIACLMTSAYITVERTFDISKGKALGLVSFGLSLGISTMAPVINGLFNYYGYFGAMLILSGILTNSFLVPFLLKEKRKTFSSEQNSSLVTDSYYGSTGNTFNENNKDVNNSNDITTTPAKRLRVESWNQDARNSNDVTNTPKKRSLPDSFKSVALRSVKLLLDAKFLHYCISLFMVSASHSIFYTFLPGLAKESGFSDKQATLLITVTGIADMCSSLTYGYVFDVELFSNKRRLIWCFPCLLMALGDSLLAFLSDEYLGIVLLAVNHGLQAGGVFGQRTAALKEIVTGSQMPLAVGYCFFYSGVGHLLGPVVTGYLKDVVGTYRICYLAGSPLAVVFAFTNILHWAVNYKKRSDKRPEHLAEEDSIGSRNVSVFVLGNFGGGYQDLTIPSPTHLPTYPHPLGEHVSLGCDNLRSIFDHDLN